MHAAPAPTQGKTADELRELSRAGSQERGSGDADGPGIGAHRAVARKRRRGRKAQPEEARRERPQLFSCNYQRYDVAGHVHGFAAGMARDEMDFRARLFERFGAMVALDARVRRGFDQLDRTAAALVSESIGDWLARASVRPRSMAPKGLDFVVERRRLA